MDDGVVTFDLSVKDTSGHATHVNLERTIYSDLGWECTFEGNFAKIINKFMGLLGYVSYDKDCIFLESVTLEEYDELLGYLDELRRKEKNEQS